MVGPAEVILAPVHHERPADDIVGAGQGDDAIDDVDARDAVAAGFDVAEVTHVAVLVLRRAMTLLLRVEIVNNT